MSWRSREHWRTVPDWRRHPIWMFKCYLLATPFKVPNSALPYSLCPFPCIPFLHDISQFLTYYKFSYFSIVSFTRMKTSRGKGLLSALLTTVSPMPRTGFGTYQTMEAWINTHTTTVQIILILKTPFFKKWLIHKESLGTSLVAQWLRIHLPMQGTWVRALVREDPTCGRATKPMRHNYWSPRRLEPVLRSKRSHCNEKPVHHNKE